MRNLQMWMHIARVLGLSAWLIALTGCKVAAILVEGGEVQSTASGTCQPAVPGTTGTVCIHEVADTSYSESFTAVPDAGWQFVKWNSGGGGFLCQNSTNPTCVVSNVGTEGNAVLEAIVASDATFYLMPVFAEVGLPITDTVTANSKEWAQVDLFTNLSWSDINAVCPAGVCNGILNNYDMTGWTWAAAEDMYSLFNSYGVTPPLAPESDFVRDGPSTWAPAFFADGWRMTYVDGNWPGQGVTGSTREQASCGQTCNWLQESAVYDGVGNSPYDVAKVLSINSFDPLPVIGAWFYRTP